MKRLMIAAALIFAAAPAFADTLKEVTTKGVTVSVQGTAMDINFTPDGNFASADGTIAGTWKADGPKLCLTIPGMVENQCTEYPANKKSGDSFDIVSDMGPMTVTIR